MTTAPALPNTTRCDQTPAWAALQSHFQAAQHFDARQALQDDAQRVAHFSQSAPYIEADLSKNLIDAKTEQLLLALAEQSGLSAWRDAMFAGLPINHSEQRQVLHVALRAGAGEQPWSSTIDSGAVQQTRADMLAYAEQIRSDAAITDIVNIGIGGSDLGPQMAVLALQAYGQPDKRLHFVSNIDGHELAAVLAQLKPENTLFLIASKTFTTIETMTNAHSAKAWFEAQGGRDISRHFAALTTNVQAAAAFGISTCFGFWDWVGGRYSLWSAIGLPIAIAIGAARFEQLLAGAAAMDEHFRHAPLAHNLPVRLGLLDVWYRNFHRFGSRCVAPYHQGLRRLPAYLQQLEMESNGKRVDRNGQPVAFATSPVVWGEPGTNGQHAFFQMLHQGTDVVPVEFIVTREASHDLPGHHGKLLANAVAQAQALLQGQQGSDGARDFPGNRPSSFLILQRLDPSSLGALIALYEHRVFTSGALWGINSFDQFGVELGKVLAKDIEPRLASGELAGLDASTAALVQRLRA
jgi:glucose-6-phosphate isomerase